MVHGIILLLPENKDRKDINHEGRKLILKDVSPISRLTRFQFKLIDILISKISYEICNKKEI